VYLAAVCFISTRIFHFLFTGILIQLSASLALHSQVYKVRGPGSYSFIFIYVCVEISSNLLCAFSASIGNLLVILEEYLIIYILQNMNEFITFCRELRKL